MLFDTIDVDDSGELAPTEFVDGMMQMRGGARARRVFELHCELQKMRKNMQQSLNVVQEQVEKVQGSLKRESLSHQSSVCKLEAKIDSVSSKVDTVSDMLVGRLDAIVHVLGASWVCHGGSTPNQNASAQSWIGQDTSGLTEL